MTAAFDTPLNSNDQSLDRVLAAGLPVLLIFLDGPAPAGMVDALARLAREQAGKALLVKLQVKDSPASARRFQVARPPAVVAVSGGQVLSRADQAGAAQLEEHLRYLLGQGPRPAATAGPAAGGVSQESARESTPAGGKPLPVTDSSFDQAVLHSPLPVVVDFWAPWCGPCRMVEPTVEKLSREYNGKARFYKMNVDENPRVSARYGIQSIPTMMVVRNGQIVDRWSGAYPEQALRGRVEPLLRG